MSREQGERRCIGNKILNITFRIDPEEERERKEDHKKELTDDVGDMAFDDLMRKVRIFYIRQTNDENQMLFSYETLLLMKQEVAWSRHDNCFLAAKKVCVIKGYCNFKLSLLPNFRRLFTDFR